MATKEKSPAPGGRNGAEACKAHAGLDTPGSRVDQERLLDADLRLWVRSLRHRLHVLALRYEHDAIGLLDGVEHDQLADEIRSFSIVVAALRGERP
jgi:hypothetical protein